MNILCFGDSNTWGLVPCVGNRFDIEKRWTGRLYELFGGKHHIIEEGLNGRTADEKDDEEPYLNGRSYMEACVLSHRPVDVLIVMLGSNDIKVRYGKSAEQIADSITALTRDMKKILDNKQAERVKVLLISPKNIDSRILGDQTFDEESIKKSEMLGGLLEKRAKAEGWLFLDAAKDDIFLGDDGLHLREDGHDSLAKHIYNILK